MTSIHRGKNETMTSGNDVSRNGRLTQVSGFTNGWVPPHVREGVVECGKEGASVSLFVALYA